MKYASINRCFSQCLSNILWNPNDWMVAQGEKLSSFDLFQRHKHIYMRAYQWKKIGKKNHRKESEILVMWLMHTPIQHRIPEMTGIFDQFISFNEFLICSPLFIWVLFGVVAVRNQIEIGEIHKSSAHSNKSQQQWTVKHENECQKENQTEMKQATSTLHHHMYMAFVFVFVANFIDISCIFFIASSAFIHHWH